MRQQSNSDLAIATLHGLGNRWEMWDPLIQNLASPIEIFSLDLPWSGQQGYLWGLKSTISEWLQLGLNTVKTDISVFLAHSFGANAVLEYLCTYQVHTLKALILISPFYKERYEFVNWSTMEYHMNHFQKLLEEGLRAHPQTKQTTRETIVAMAEKVRERIGPYGWLQFFNMYSRTPGLNLQAIQIPCLVLGGEHDFASFALDCKALARNLPNGTVEILTNCGHFSILENPRIVVSIIDRFLKQVLDC